MTIKKCPHCGYEYDDQTGEISDKPKAAPVFKILDELRGYRPPKRAAEAASILRMLKKYTPEQIIDTWKKLKADKFYQDKELYMMTVEGQIGAIVAASKGQYIIRPEKFTTSRFAHMVQR